MVTLIRNRTQAHVDRLKLLRSIGYENLSSSEQDEYHEYCLKGAYNFLDLNRVETAVSELADVYGMKLVTKTNWDLFDLPTESDMRRYLDNVAAIRDACQADVQYPTLPDNMNNLTWQKANDIERTLHLVQVNLPPEDVTTAKLGSCRIGKMILGEK